MKEREKIKRDKMSKRMREISIDRQRERVTKGERGKKEKEIFSSKKN